MTHRANIYAGKQAMGIPKACLADSSSALHSIKVKLLARNRYSPGNGHDSNFHVYLIHYILYHASRHYRIWSPPNFGQHPQETPSAGLRTDTVLQRISDVVASRSLTINMVP